MEPDRRSLVAAHRILTAERAGLVNIVIQSAVNFASGGDTLLTEVALQAWDRAGRPGGVDALAPVMLAAVVRGRRGAMRAVLRRGRPGPFDPERRDARSLLALSAATVATGEGKFSQARARSREEARARVAAKSRATLDALQELAGAELVAELKDARDAADAAERARRDFQAHDRDESSDDEAERAPRAFQAHDGDESDGGLGEEFD